MIIRPNMKSLITLVIFVLRFLHVVSGQSKMPTKICSVAGTDTQLVPSKTNPEEIPPLCEVVCYGFYYLDKVPAVTGSDIEAINALRKQNRTVYVRVTYSGAPDWNGILKSMSETGPGELFNTNIKPMEEHFKNHSIAGVVLDKLGLFEDCDVKQLNLFLKQIKMDLPELKLCILVNASQSASFGKKDLKDVNSVVDLYIIDMIPTARICNPDVADTGRFTKDGLQKVTADVSNSSMAKTKLMINFLDEVTICEVISKITYGVAYGEVCDFVDHQWSGPDAYWCMDDINTFTEQATCAKEHYAGIMVSYLEYDDYHDHCKCGIFPIANTFLNVYDGKPGPVCKIFTKL